MSDIAVYLVLSAAVFAGAFVSGLSGFAFSAVAGAILLHVYPPMEAVPLMMACSITVQAANLFALRKSMQWKTSLVFIGGGLLGIPIAIYLLQNVDTRTFRLGFGALVVLYATYALFRPAPAYARQMQSQGRNALVGFGGGLVGGLTAMPGALPAIWCDIHGFPKTQQRGLVQPYIGVMQLFALALMLSHHSLSLKVLVDFGIALPALAAGTAVGIVLFGRINESAFKRIVLGLLLFSGLCLLL
ncbi:sulfite exporter TauE/SafE family protein [Bradyrhizobium sp. LjRoot220]|uniref:sulfite exporter TauE/SafE family protein n=1 Tax=Bradyrhizobium sp. LjRoot220 TaxID=3342284 RepID=UPI003ECFB532